MPPTLALIVSYDGLRFAGAQAQPGQRTVQGELDAALARLAGGPIGIVLAGRTDRGVHAAGQVVSCDDPRPDWPLDRLRPAHDAPVPPGRADLRTGGLPAGFHG